MVKKRDFYRDFGSISSDSITTDIYNKMLDDKKKGRKPKKYNEDSWMRLKHSKKGQRCINKKLVNENERLHELQHQFKQRIQTQKGE